MKRILQQRLINLSLQLYKDYWKMFFPITIFGIIFWALDKLITFDLLSPFYYIFSASAHILFGIWFFIAVYIIIYTLLLKFKKYRIRNIETFVLSILIVLSVSIYFDLTNEFVNNYSSNNCDRTYLDDVLDTYFNVLGTLFIFLCSAYTFKFVLYKKRR